MRRTTIALLAAVGLALSGCGGADDDTSDAKPSVAKKAAASPVPAKLDPIWSPKLDAAAGEDGEAVAACQQPSSNACARYVGDIMDVVSGLEAEIDRSGWAYPKTLEQVETMKDAELEYVDNGCQGDVTADDPNSLCHGVVHVTLGAATVQMTLLTDELGQ